MNKRKQRCFLGEESFLPGKVIMHLQFDAVGNKVVAKGRLYINCNNVQLRHINVIQIITLVTFGDISRWTIDILLLIVFIYSVSRDWNVSYWIQGKPCLKVITFVDVDKAEALHLSLYTPSAMRLPLTPSSEDVPGTKEWEATLWDLMNRSILLLFWKSIYFEIYRTKYTSKAQLVELLQEGGPLLGPETGLLLTLGNELSEETHVLTKQESLLGKGTRAESSRVREPRTALSHGL